MSDQVQQNSSDEIDLSFIFDKIKSIFKSFLIGVVMIFQFFWKHKFRLMILLVIGIGLQYLFSKQVEKIYVNEFLVRTNFESTEYLYGKVNAINGKLQSDDSLYLKNVFGTNYERVKELEVIPIIDVYGLVNSSQENRETFELLLDEYGDISFLEEGFNVNKYATHKIKIYIKGLDENETISNKAFNFISNNPFYNELKQITLKSYQEQLEENKVIRAQIDTIIKEQKGSEAMPELDNNTITFTGSQNFNELLAQKRRLLDNDLEIREQLSSEDKVLKTIDSSFGVLSENRNTSLIVIPLIIIGLYIFFFFFKFLRSNTQKFLER